MYILLHLKNTEEQFPKVNSTVCLVKTKYEQVKLEFLNVNDESKSGRDDLRT